MRDIVKFSILFIVCALLLTIISGYVAPVFSMFGASFNYISTGSVGIVFAEIVGFVGWFLDILFISNEVVYTTYYGGIAVGSLSWALTFVRVVFGLVVAVLILNLILSRD